MNVLSFVFVVAAGITLVVGFFQDGLGLIYTSIGLTVASLILLFIGVMQRRANPPQTPSATYSGPAPAAVQMQTQGGVAPVQQPAPPAPPPAYADDEEAEIMSLVGDDAGSEIVRPRALSKSATPAKRAKKPSKKIAAKRPGRPPAKKLAKKAAKATARPVKKPAKKTAAKKATKKAAAKKAATSITTGAAAREVLGAIKGVGAAKQDALLKKFKSLEGISAADPGDLAAIKGVGDSVAKELKAKLRKYR